MPRRAALDRQSLIALGPERLADLLLERQGEFGDDHYDLFSAAAERLSADHPLAATVALRSMVDFTLSKGRSSRYRYAAEHLHSCQLLSQRISDWGAITPHALYIARVPGSGVNPWGPQPRRSRG